MSFHYLDYIFMAIVIVISIHSFKCGFLKRKSTFLSCLIAFAATCCVIHFVPDSLSIFREDYKILSFALIFAVLWILIKLLLHLFSKSISKTIILGTADKLLGLLVGLLQSLMLVFAIGCVLYFFAKDFAMHSVLIRHFIHFIQ